MWISKKMSEAAREDEPAVSLGEITIGGGSAGAVTSSEKRDMAIVSPGGFVWKPKSGQSVLVLKTGEGERVIAGAVQGTNAGLKTGEVKISSNGASITLKNDGSILVSGNLSVSGNFSVEGSADIGGGLTVAGVPYSPCVCSLM